MKLGLRALRGVLVVSLLSTVVVPLAAAPARAVAPTGTTTLVSPAEGDTVQGSPTFTWTRVPGAVAYRLDVSHSPLFELGTIVYSIPSTVNLHATPPVALPVDTKLYWRVAPTDGTTNGTGTGTFTSGSFTRVWAGAPQLTEPADTYALKYPDEPLLFTWRPLDGAQKYKIEIDDATDFVGATTATTNNTSYTLLDPQTNDQWFYWRVQGISGNVFSPYSETRSYKVVWPEVPTPVSPLAGAADVQDVVLQWTPVAGATGYQVQISPAKDFANNIVVNATNVRGTRYSPGKSLPADGYYWRVRAFDGKSPTPNYGAWSTVGTGGADPVFTRRWPHVPELQWPANDARVVVPTLRWDPVPYASHYELHVSTDSHFSEAATVSCYTAQTSFTPYKVVNGGTDTADPPGACGITPATLPIGQYIYWKVRGIDAGRSGTPILGEFSAQRQFTFWHDLTVTPVVTGPAHGAVVTTPELSWERVRGVARYRVSVFLNGANVAGSPFTTYSTSYTPARLDAGKSYTWRVVTVDDAGREGPHFGDRTFTVQAPEATATSAVNATPFDATEYALMPSLSWLPVVNATKYDVYMGRVGASALYKGETTGTSYTSPDLPTEVGEYYWYVQAKNQLGGTIGQPSSPTTFTLTDLAVVSGYSPAKCGTDQVCAASPETPLLSWDPVVNASGYRVYISNDASFTNTIREYSTQHTSITPRESLLDSDAGKAYYYFVKPCRDAFNGRGCGRKDSTVYPLAGEFRKQSTPVKLLSPADGAVVPENGTSHENITFTWEEYQVTNSKLVPAASQGAKLYRVQVSTAADFKSILDTEDVDETTYTPHDMTYPEGPLFWRVRALDGSGNELAVSEVRQVTKASPRLQPLDPAPGGSVAITPYFRWAAQPHVKEYELEVYRNGDKQFSSVNQFPLGATLSSKSQKTRLTAFTPLTSLPAGTYAWRVRRIDAGSNTSAGLPGPWASGDVFTLRTTVPTLRTPADGTTFSSNDVVFGWAEVGGVAKYKFEASTSSGFPAPLTDSVTTVMNQWAPTKAYPDGTIYWRVSLLDAADQVVGVSPTWSITRDLTAPKVLTKTPAAAAPLTGGFTVTFSERVRGLSSSTFRMSVPSTGAALAGTVTPGVDTTTTTATFTPSVPLTPGETYTLSLTSGITDVNGNALVPFSWSTRTALVVDTASSAVQQYWDRDTSSLASGGGYLASATKAARAGYTFTGTSASILGRKGPDGGYAEVWVDNVKKATVSFYSSTVRWKQVVWSTSALTSGTHTVELRVLGTRPAGSAGAWVYPDAFRYGATTLEETSAQVVQANGVVGKSTALGGSYVLATHTLSGDTGTQPNLVMRFKGTGFGWKGFRGPRGGIAKVYVDGALKATVDTYAAAASSSPESITGVSGLPNATHTLKIVLTGTRRTGSAGYEVTFDSFSVL